VRALHIVYLSKLIISLVMNAVENALPEGLVQALVQSFAMILVSEIGDKTFLIAAILAMRHPRMLVFAGAFGSLVVMSILSAAMGHLLPTLIPRKWTQIAASVLFMVFGAKMFIEARGMKAGNEKIQEEMREAEEEIEDDDAGHDGTGGASANGLVIPLEDMEAGGRPVQSPRPKGLSPMEGARNFCSFFLGPVFVQAFVLTFLGEWGDRSQIATIALGAAHVRRSFDVTPVVADDRLECLSGYAWNRCGPLVLHGAGGHWREIRVHEDIRQTGYVFPPLFFVFSWLTPS
jgi:putative Ca2+/H+ antiporter (TMEM165/GDT1 family)